MNPAVAYWSSSARSKGVGFDTSARRCQSPLLIPFQPCGGDSQNAGQSTVGDVLGTRQATIDPLPYLAGTLPYSIKAQFKYENRWIAYKKVRGQYSSAMEHAVPEQFWVDKTQCRYTDDQGQTQNPTKADCAQAVSAVKAIAIAQAEGQRIYTINQRNAATALPKLPVGGTVGQKIASAIQAGKEVTFHERQINAHGFSGYGYVITDPETGAGAYMIEGRGNGGWMDLVNWVKDNPGWSAIAALALGIVAGVGGWFGAILLLMSFVISAISIYHDMIAIANAECGVLGLQALFGALTAIVFGIGLLGGAVGAAIALAIAGSLISALYADVASAIKKIPGVC